MIRNRNVYARLLDWLLLFGGHSRKPSKTYELLNVKYNTSSIFYDDVFYFYISFRVFC